MEKKSWTGSHMILKEGAGESRVTEGICGWILRGGGLSKRTACHCLHHTTDSATKYAYLLISLFNTRVDCVCVSSLSCCCEIGPQGRWDKEGDELRFEGSISWRHFPSCVCVRTNSYADLFRAVVLVCARECVLVRKCVWGEEGAGSDTDVIWHGWGL